MAVPKKKKNLKIVGKKAIKKKRTVKKQAPKLKSSTLERFAGNPVVTPDKESAWQSRAAFNAAAMENDGKVHIIYRAVGNDDISTFGYAASSDGLHFTERSSKPIYSHRKKTSGVISVFPINYSSGGGTSGGAEDPRIANIDGRVYMVYTAFDGWGSLRLTLTSISLEDFLNKKWNWKEPVLISPPGEIHKNWVIFPEKINGKFAIMHSFYPKILINYFDSLDELDGKTFIKSNNTRPVDTTRTWDSWFRGVGPTPIKTKEGWLVLYHAMDHRNPSQYKIGALLLDLKDPTKILYRSKTPVLEPDAIYENVGFKAGVVYSCGAVIKGKDLFVYYGGADTVTCIARANLQKFLEELKKTGKVKLTKRIKNK